MKLKLKDRLVILSILPQKASFNDQLIAEEIRKKVKVEADEAKALDIQEDEKKGLFWDEKKDKEKEFEFNDPEKNVIKQILIGLDGSKEVTQDMINIYKLFT